MSHRPQRRSLTPFDGGYHVHLRHHSASYGNGTNIHKKAASRDGFGDVRPWHRDLAECDYHVCKVNRGNDVFDYIGGQLRYVGRSYSDRDAISKWQAFLQTIGVHAENAVMLDG